MGDTRERERLWLEPCPRGAQPGYEPRPREGLLRSVEAGRAALWILACDGDFDEVSLTQSIRADFDRRDIGGVRRDRMARTAAGREAEMELWGSTLPALP